MVWGRDDAVLGRTGELHRLAVAFGLAGAGEPRIAVVAGEAGIGKTALVRASGALAEEREAVMAIGYCVDVDRELAFAPVRGMFRALVRRLPELPAIADRHPYVTRLVPGPDMRPASSEELDPVFLFESALALLAEVTETYPLVLVIEDLHWADASTLELLTFLIRNLTSERLALVLTVRSDEVADRDRLARFLTEVDRSPLAERIDVPPLRREHLSALARHATGGEPSMELLDVLEQRSEGNPFYAKELLASGAAVEGDLPPSLHQALTLRLGGLPEDAARIVRAAAAIGREVDPDLLAAVLAETVDSVAAGLRTAVAQRVLRLTPESGRAVFAHALLEETAYSALIPGERRRLHAAVADTLAARPDLAERWEVDALLAHHHERAGRVVDAVEASLRAAEAAIGSFGFEEAQSHFERVLELWDRAAAEGGLVGLRRGSVMLRAAEAAGLGGNYARAQSILEAAVRLVDPAEDPALWARVVDHLTDTYWHTGQGAEALAVLAEARTTLEPMRGTLPWARVMRRWVHSQTVQGRYGDEIKQAAEDALDIARREGDRALEAEALDILGVVNSGRGRLNKGVALMRDAIALGTEIGDARSAGRAGINIGFTLLAAGRYRDALEATAEALRIAASMGLERSYRLLILSVHADALVVLGEWDRAEQALADIPDQPAARVRSYLGLPRARLAIGQGRLDDAERYLADLGIDAEPSSFHQARWVIGTAELHYARGHPEQALEIVKHYVDLGTRLPDASLQRMCATGLKALGLLATDRAEADALLDVARRRIEAVPPERATPDTPAWWAAVQARHADLTGAPSASHWRDAVRAFEDNGMIFDAARARVGLAAALVTGGGERQEAADALAVAREVTARVGAAPLQQELDDLARRARLAVPGVTALPTEEQLGLTDREVEVLRLLAEGDTNREIGEKLFISTRTASVHVSNIIRKLGVGNRGEAAAIAHRHGFALQRD